MADLRDSINHTAMKICDDLKLVPSYKNFYADIQVSKTKS